MAMAALWERHRGQAAAFNGNDERVVCFGFDLSRGFNLEEG